MDERMRIVTMRPLMTPLRASTGVSSRSNGASVYLVDQGLGGNALRLEELPAALRNPPTDAALTG
jgi:hypothetical protein